MPFVAAAAALVAVATAASAALMAAAGLWETAAMTPLVTVEAALVGAAGNELAALVCPESADAV